MIWVLAFIAALLGAALAAEERALFGFGAGFALALAFGLLQRQGRKIDQLEARVAALVARAAQRAAEPRGEPEAKTAPVVPETTPSPWAADREATPPPIPEPASPPARADTTFAPPRAEPTPPPSPGPQSTAAGESLPIERFTAALRAFLFEGNVPVKLGLIVSLFGVGALIRYAASAGLLEVPVALRYAAIALAGLGLLVYGLKQVPKRPVFGLALQGGAIGILLLTVFGSFRVPGLLPAGLAFVLVLSLVTGAAVLAIRQNAVWLAAIGFLGGYLAPLLLSTGSGNHVALFSYYALLNGAVFGMAWVRPWRALNLMGFAFTFGVGALWGARYFRPELFASTEPFLVLFFLMYVTLPVLYALKGRTPGRVDATLLFGTPLIAFPMQVALLDGERMPLAFSALAVGAVYLGLALWSRREPKLKVLAQSAAALGLAFATLAVPLALSARWTSATWALQGVALLWLGQAQQRAWPKFAGVALQGLAGLAYVASFDSSADATAVLNGHSLNLLLLVAAAGLCAWLLDRESDHQRSSGGALLAVVASAWWLWFGVREIAINLDGARISEHLDIGAAWLGFVALTCLVATLLLARVDWRKPAWWPAFALPAAILGVILLALETPGWLGEPQGLMLPALLASMAVVLPRLRDMPRRLASAHIGGLAAACLALGLGIHEALSTLNAGHLGDAWRWTLPWLPLAALTAALALRPRLAAWPVGDAIPHYRRLALGLAGAVLGGVWLMTLASRGEPKPLPWVPLLNPIELFHLAGLVALLALRQRMPDAGTRRLAEVGLMLGAFMAMSMATLRSCLHLVDDAPTVYAWSRTEDWLSIAAMPEAQAALSVVWSLAGVTCWVLGSKRQDRGLWTYGAAMLGLVLLKLLVVDRSNLGDLLGIVSFLVVGGLLVVVGRIAPRPPAAPMESP